MNLSCDVIRDILPLYAEDMVSGATRELVDEHLCGCDGCTKELAALKKTPKVPVDTEVNSLKRVSDSIRKRKILTVLCVVMTIVSILMTGMEMCFNTQIYLPITEAIENVEFREDGGLTIDYARAIVGRGSISDGDDEVMYCNTTVYDYIREKLLDRKLAKMNREEIEDYIRKVFKLEQMYNRTEVTEEDWNRFFNIHTVYSFRDQNGVLSTFNEPKVPDGWEDMPFNEGKVFTRTNSDYNLIYMGRDGAGQVVLHEGGREAPNMEVYKQFKAWYLWEEAFYGCGLIAVGLWLLLRRKKEFRCRELVVGIALAFGCVAFGILAISFGQFNYTGEQLSYSWLDGMIGIAVPTLLAALLWRRLYVLNHQS